MTARTTYRHIRAQTGYELRIVTAHWRGVSDLRLVRAREGTNLACVDCGGEPLGGGLRCGPCFTAVVAARPGRRVAV